MTRPGATAARHPGATGTASAASSAGSGRPAGRWPPRGRDPWRAAFFAVAVLAVLAGTAWALLGSSLLVVRSVRVTGTRVLPAAAVLQAAGVRSGTPLARIDTAQVAHRVEQLPLVLSARVSRSWPDALVISVRERAPAVAVLRQGLFQVIDEFGVVLRSVPARPAGVPLLRPAPAGDLRGSAPVRTAAIVLAELPGGLRMRVAVVQVPGPDRVQLDLRGGAAVQWGGTGGAVAKAAELTILLRQHSSSYDVSAPGTAVTGG